ncbi:MAG: biotin/lipoyl-binding protein [Coriobacteriia bacterium]|nr:biotin/lipoyl-binding protein [Coriobacteriia bacterium]
MVKTDSLDMPSAEGNREYTQQEITQAAAELQAFKALEGRSAKQKRTKRLRLIIIIVAVLLALVFGAAFIGSILGSGEQGAFQATDTITRGDYVDSIDVSGNLAAFEQVTITPEVDGTVSALYVSEGDAVEAGQLLFTLDNPDLDQAVSTAQLGVGRANMHLQGAQSTRDEAGGASERALVNYNTMLEAYNASAGQPDVDDMPTNKKLTQADVDQAYEVYRQSVSAVTSADFALADAKIALGDANTALSAAIAVSEKRNIYSPISGLVVLNNIERGTKLSTLAPAGQVPMQIAMIDQMNMTVSVNEIDILSVEPGMRALISVDALDGYSTDAEVLRVASTPGATDEMSFGGRGGLVTYKVDLLIKNPDPRLKIGMSADAKIVLQKLDNVFMVNAMAVHDAGAYSFLLVLEDDGSMREAVVKVIASNNTLAAIEGDIREGDEVLLDLGYDSSPMMQQQSTVTVTATSAS